MISTRRIKPPFQLSGGGVPDGGTEHAGHAYWKSTITPFQAAAVNPAPPEPSLYARPVVLNLPSIVTRQYGVLRGKKPDLHSLLQDLLKPKTVVGGPENNPPGGGGGPGGGDKELPPGGPGVPESDVPPPLDPEDNTLPMLLTGSESSEPQLGGKRVLRVNTERLVENNFGQLGSEHSTPSFEGTIEYDSPQSDGFAPMVQKGLMRYPDLTFSKQNYNTPYYHAPDLNLQLNNSTDTFNIDVLPIKTDLDQALLLGITEADSKRIAEDAAFEAHWAIEAKHAEEAMEKDEDLFDRYIKLGVPLPNDLRGFLNSIENRLRQSDEMRVRNLRMKSLQIQKKRHDFYREKAAYQRLNNSNDWRLVNTNNPINAQIFTEPVQNVDRNVLKLSINTNKVGEDTMMGSSSESSQSKSPPSSGELFSPSKPGFKYGFGGAYVSKKGKGRKK